MSRARRAPRRTASADDAARQTRGRRGGAHRAPTRVPAPPWAIGRERWLPAPVGGVLVLAITVPMAMSMSTLSGSSEATGLRSVTVATTHDADIAGREKSSQRASRSRSAVSPAVSGSPVASAGVAPATPPWPSAAPLIPGCDVHPGARRQYRNGRVPGGALCSLPGYPGEALLADAAYGFIRLNEAYSAALGERLCVLDSYRTLSEQRTLRSIKPRWAARPGTSEHGWGVALDLGCGVQSYRSREHRWLREHAAAFGWTLPTWARRGGSKPEPWHWEYTGE